MNAPILTLFHGRDSRRTLLKVEGVRNPAPEGVRINLTTVPVMHATPSTTRSGARPFGARPVARFMAAMASVVACVWTVASANDVIGWGALKFDSKDTTTYQTSVTREVFQLSCGGGHTLALRLDPSLPTQPVGPLGGSTIPQEGVVMAWGFNESGQAAVGLETVPGTAQLRPWTAVQVAAGYAHSMLLRKDGSVQCWGDNSFGQCWAPADVRNPQATNPVVQIAAGQYFSLALMKDGTLRGWGDNRMGQLDFPVLTALDAPKPADIGKPMRFFRVSAGGGHVLALKAKSQSKGDYGSATTVAREVLAWGDGLAGQTTLPKLYNVSSTGVATERPMVAIDIAAGQYHSLALMGGLTGTLPYYETPADSSKKAQLRSGMILGWGNDDYGQAVVPSMRASTDSRFRDWEANRKNTFVQLAAGGYHSVAVTSDGYVYCWGLGASGSELYGDYGQVNDDTTKVNISTRQPQVGILCDTKNLYVNSKLVAAGLYHTGAVSLQWDTLPGTGGPKPTKAVDVAVTWGRNYEAQCDVPYETNYALSRKVFHAVPAVIKGSVPNSRHPSDLRSVWSGGFMPTRDYGFFNDFTVALDNYNLPVGWGDNTSLQREFFAPTSPVVLVPAKKYKTLSAGGTFSWMLDTTGQAWFVGDPFLCFAGESTLPDRVVADVSAGGFHSLFRTAGGMVLTTGGAPTSYWDETLGMDITVNWGQGAWSASGEYLGNTKGTRVITGLTAQNVSAGWFHSAAVRSDGTVTCWGAGEDGTLDPKNLTNLPNFQQSIVPAGVTGATQVAAGGFHTVALTDVDASGEGTVRTWGSNREGQRNISAIESAVAGTNFVALRRVDGRVKAWGNTLATNGVLGVDNQISGALFAGYGTAAILDGAGTPHFFGDMTDAMVPLDPNTALPVRLTSMAIGEAHVLGIRQDGSVVAWGSNTKGQCWGFSGAGVLTQPAPARRSHDGLNSPACSAVGLCNGTDGGTPVSEYPVDPVGLVRMSLGDMGVTTDDEDVCTASVGAATCSLGLTDKLLYARQVAAGKEHSLALRADGMLQSWGAFRGTSQLPGAVVSDTPSFGFAFVKVAAGGTHSLALRITGAVEAWGSNTYNQVTPTNEIPGGLRDVLDIAAGERHSVILKYDGTVHAWGDAQGSTQPPADSPVRLGVEQRGIVIAAGGRNTVVLQDRFDPAVFGVMGAEPVPAISDDALKAIAVRAGGFHSVALMKSGTVAAWGAGQNRAGAFPNYGQATVPARAPTYDMPTVAQAPAVGFPNTITAGATSSAALRIRNSNFAGDTSVPQDPQDSLPDLDGDGCVTMSDLGALLMELGNMGWPGGDLDGSGEIDMGDVAILQMSLGDCDPAAQAD